MYKPRGYWDIKDNVFKEAKKYQTRSEFCRCCGSAYDAARKHNWLGEMTWFKEIKRPNGYWTKEKVFEEAKAYSTKIEFRKCCSGAYNVAHRNGWLSEMTWFKEIKRPNGYWTKEKVFEEAKAYSTKIEFRKCCSGAYNVARKNGWINEMNWFVSSQKPSGYWNNKENVFEKAREYQTRKEFFKGCGSAYNVALRNGWLDEMTWFIEGKLKAFTIKKNDCVYKYYWEETNSIYIGRTTDKIGRNDRHKKEGDTVFRYAKENGLAVPPMEIIEENITVKEGLEREDYWVNYYKEKGYNVLNKAKTGIGSGSTGAIACGKWTKEKVFEKAREYKTRWDFGKKCVSAYTVARKNGWLDEMTWFIEIIKPRGYWTKEKVFEEASKYNTRKEFFKGCVSAYNVARRYNLLDELFPKKSVA